MKKLGNTIQKWYASERFRWLFSLLCALAIVGIAAWFSTLTYYDNDDLNIAWALAGQPDPEGGFDYGLDLLIAGLERRLA